MVQVFKKNLRKEKGLSKKEARSEAHNINNPDRHRMFRKGHVVFRDGAGGTRPTIVHDNFGIAIKEVKRLSKKYPGDDIIIAEVVLSARNGKVTLADSVE
jgi:hypothetical protein